MAQRLDAWWGLAAEARDLTTAALATHGRAADPEFRRMLQTDAAPVLSIQSADCFDDFLGRADELGFTDVVAPWPRAQGPGRPDRRGRSPAVADFGRRLTVTNDQRRRRCGLAVAGSGASPRIRPGVPSRPASQQQEPSA
jgi:hypothetical protein